MKKKRAKVAEKQKAKVVEMQAKEKERVDKEAKKAEKTRVRSSNKENSTEASGSRVPMDVDETSIDPVLRGSQYSDDDMYL